MEQDIQNQTEQLAIAYKRVFDCEDGAKVLDDLMRKGHVLNSQFISDPYAMAFDQGKRQMVLDILRTLNFDIEKFRKRLQEMNNV